MIGYILGYGCQIKVDRRGRVTLLPNFRGFRKQIAQQEALPDIMFIGAGALVEQICRRCQTPRLRFAERKQKCLLSGRREATSSEKIRPWCCG